MTTAVVWFKRDLRVADHAPLLAASAHPRALGLYALEPEWLQSPECSPRHAAFALACLAPLRTALAGRGLPLLVRHSGVVEALDRLHARTGFTHLYSHEETGPGWSYTRDLAVARWCRERGVQWHEFPQTGVVRRLRSRSGWARRWSERMNAPTADAPAASPWPALSVHDLRPLPTLADLGLPATPLPDWVQAGETAAHVALQRFLAGPVQRYPKGISSPLSAPQACSLLSPHLAFGTLSVRQVHQATLSALAQTDDPAARRGLRAFDGRLHWHCHFMQKLEDEPAIEWRHFARAHDGLRPGDVEGGGRPFNALERQRFEAWCEGRTGHPMVDACMRQLRATGWLNFRMRAMLVSFATQHLWLHWREPGLFLARQLLDFEPGIHWSQMQMQSGTTGINTLRVYSPTKQALDHDPTGDYRRQWLPEWPHGDYPPPLVDERQAMAAAQQKLHTLRKGPQARAEADAVQARHGSRQSGLAPRTAAPKKRPPPEAAKPDTRQGSLF